MSINKLQKIKSKAAEIGIFFVLAITAISILFPVLIMRQVSAAGQITLRSLAISSGVPSKTNVQYTFTFTVSSTSDVEGLKFQACTTAVGTCSAPAGLSFSSVTFGTQSGWQGGTNFAIDGTGANDCTPSASIICANRTDATAQTTTSRSIRFDTITNPSTANSTFFVRVGLYSANNYTTGAGFVDYGVTASAVVQTLTTSAAVAEVLNFCVGSTVVNDAETTATLPTSCAGVTGTGVNIGVLSTSGVNVSPVDAVDGGDDLNGLVMLRTNSQNGTTVSYDAIQATTGTNHLGTLRITGYSCNAGTVSTDGCINAIGTTADEIDSGVEEFGMTIAGVSCDSTTSYSCVFSSTNYNLIRDAQYDGDGTASNTTNFTDTGVVSGTTTSQYAWDETGSFDQIASSSTYVDDEVLLLKFAATSALITPFGSYTVQTDFVAVTTY